MKYLLVVISLFMISNDALAGWIKLFDFATPTLSKATSYYDQVSRRGDGHLYTAQFLRDYTAVQITFDSTHIFKEYLSNIEKYEFDCDHKKNRTLERGIYSKNMGLGEKVNYIPEVKDTLDEWIPVQTGSNGEHYFERVCAVSQIYKD